MNFLIKLFNFLSISSLLLISQTFNSFARADNYGDYKNFIYYQYLDINGDEIIDLVDRSKKVIFYPRENTPDCKSDPMWGYVNSAYKSSDGYFQSDLVICSNRIIGYSNNWNDISYYINATLHHEAFHAAQICKSPPQFNTIGLNNGIFDQRIRDIVFESETYRNLPYEDKLQEMEAFYVEHKPEIVSSYLEDYCY